MYNPSRTLVVGDIQGCADELSDLLSAAAFVPGTDHLIAAGDLVNKGPKSLDVLHRLRDLGADIVLGNHDIHLLAVAAGLRNAAGDTFQDVLAADDLPELLDWLVDRPEPLVWQRDFAVVHAGVPPSFRLPVDADAVNEFVRTVWGEGTPLAARVSQLMRDPRVRFLTCVRYCRASGEMPEDDDVVDPPGFRPWFDFRPSEPRIAFGHWARLDRERPRPDFVRHLDTGCVYGGELTGWWAEADRLVSVPARRAYWPPL